MDSIPIYQPHGLALEIFQKRYALHDQETWEQACERVASTIAVAETGESGPKYRTLFADLLKRNIFMPGGRIWYGAGRPKGQCLNCFVVPTSDSREGWGRSVSDMIVIAGTGGGMGINCSPIRPRGSVVNGSGGKATGAVSLMEIMNAAGEVIKGGGGRRVALMFALNLNHGDIQEFLDKKLDLKQLNNGNVSVVFNEDPEDFFKKVKKDEKLDLMFQGRIVASVPAKAIWSKIISNALKGGEPGILNGYLANKMSNTWNLNQLVASNPCITGDTLIAVADGRNAVSIRQLAEEGKDVPVYSVNPVTGQTEIKLGINPRKTGIESEVWKLTLDDGSVIRATSNHKFMLKDLSTKQMRDLKIGDSLRLQTKWKTNWKEVMGEKCNSNSQDYWATHDGNKMRFEHSIFAEFYGGSRLLPGQVVHHADFDGLNNSPNNLVIMSKYEHYKYHAEKMKGERNPYHRMTDKWKLKFACHPGKDNGMFGKENKWGNHSEEAKQYLSFIKTGKRHSLETKSKLSFIRKQFYQNKKKAEGTPDFIQRFCPGCHIDFIVPWRARERIYCSNDCKMKYISARGVVAAQETYSHQRIEKREKWLKLYSDLKLQLGREPLKKEFEKFCIKEDVTSRFGPATFPTFSSLKESSADYSHKVTSVEFCGYEDVYNITVEDNHNFGIVVSTMGKTKSGKDKQYHIFTPQCGELWLPAYGCCNLGALVLPRFINNKVINWELLATTIDLGVRFLDDVLTVNNYPLPEIKQTAADERRIGLGVMGLHDMLLLLGLKYNSDAGLEMIDRVMKFIKNTAYEASVKIAQEKGAFPKFNPELYLKSGFIKTLKPSLRSKIQEFGIRNCALLTIAPTGTTSMVAEVTSGIEAMFAPAYIRRFQDGDQLKSEVVIHPLFKQFVQEGKSTKHFQGAFDLDIEDHFEVQRICQRHLDNACSKTINLPPGVSEKRLSDLYMEYFPELKGVTIYPEGSRENQPLTPMSLEEALAHITTAKVEPTAKDSCKNGLCDIG